MRGRFEARLAQHRLVAILRDVPDTHVEPLAEALIAGGVRLLEVALTGPGGIAQIRRLRAALADEIEVGAGTVTTRSLAERAHEAGASFFVTPHISAPVNKYAAEHDLGLVCGALTPTEIAAAREHGSRFVKLFPASLVGPAYVRALLGPYPDLELIVVGGVGPANLNAFLQAGAVGAGIGSSLTALGGSYCDFRTIASRARNLTNAMDR